MKVKFVAGKDHPNRPRGWCSHYAKGYCDMDAKLQPGRTRCLGSNLCEEYRQTGGSDDTKQA